MDFRDKINNLKADPAQGAWQEMSTMLDQNKPSKGISKFWVFVIIILFFAASIIASFALINNSKKDNSQFKEQTNISEQSQLKQDGKTSWVENSNSSKTEEESSRVTTDQHSVDKLSLSQTDGINSTNDIKHIENKAVHEQVINAQAISAKDINNDKPQQNSGNSREDSMDLKNANNSSSSSQDLLGQGTADSKIENNIGRNNLVEGSSPGISDSKSVLDAESSNVNHENDLERSNAQATRITQLSEVEFIGMTPISLLTSNNTDALVLGAKFDQARLINVVNLGKNIMDFGFTYGGADGVSPIVHYRAGYRRVLTPDWAIGVRFGLVRGNKKAKDISLINIEQIPSFIEAYNSIAQGADENTRVEYTDMTTYSIQVFRHLLQKNKVNLWAGIGPRYSRISQQRIISIYFDDGFVSEIEAEQKNYNSIDLEFSIEMEVSLQPNFKMTGIFNAAPGLAYYSIGIGSKVYF
ncbi:MAG: hypothetical protein HKN09_02120 [Saprospiraceae bacterium]|nr:hypothetical protein [Saprospiraceae bacterium]